MVSSVPQHTPVRARITHALRVDARSGAGPHRTLALGHDTPPQPTLRRYSSRSQTTASFGYSLSRHSSVSLVAVCAHSWRVAAVTDIDFEGLDTVTLSLAARSIYTSARDAMLAVSATLRIGRRVVSPSRRPFSKWRRRDARTRPSGRAGPGWTRRLERGPLAIGNSSYGSTRGSASRVSNSPVRGSAVPPRADSVDAPQNAVEVRVRRVRARMSSAAG